MPGKTIRIGPFKGGLNNASDPSAIADDELAICQNFEFDVDGALSSRPPITTYVAAPVSETMHILGYFVDDNGTSWLLGATDTAVYYDNSGTWTLVQNSVVISCMVQYGSKAWLIADPTSANPGGSWTPAGGFTAVAAMPKGMAGQIYKDRLYIAAGSKATTNTSRVSFSNNGDPSLWTSSDFIDVNPGDGEKLIDLYTSGNSLYCFKSDSTWIFSYDSAPTKGVLQPISHVVGVSDIECIAQYENTIYVYHEGFVYELVNYIYTKLNYKIDLVPDNSVVTNFKYPVSLFRVSDRVVLRYFDKIYVFNLRTRTWTTWKSIRLFGRFTQVPKPSTSSASLSYIAGSCELNNPGTFKFTDEYSSSASESMTCIARTKIFDFNSPNLFKRLYWWGVDAICQGTVTGIVTPVIYSFNVTWGQLSSHTWGSLASYTWGQPLNAVPTVTDSAVTAGSVGRRFIKFLKSIRFRNVYFEIQMTTTGTASDAPVKLFTINPVVSEKEQVSRRIG